MGQQQERKLNVDQAVSTIIMKKLWALHQSVMLALETGFISCFFQPSKLFVARHVYPFHFCTACKARGPYWRVHFKVQYFCSLFVACYQ